MNYKNMTKKELIDELVELRRQINELEKSESKHKLFEEALAEKEHYFSTLINNIHEDIMVIDRNYRITDANNAFQVTSGYKREEVIGRHCYEISHGYITRCDKHGERCMLLEVFKTGKPRNCRHVHIRKDDEKIYVDILLSPLKDRNGNVTHVIEAVRDITDVYEAEEALRLTQFSVDTASVGVFWLTPEGKIIYTNEAACRNLGYTKEELFGMSVADIDPDHPAERRPAYWKKLKRNKVLLFESRYRIKDGRVFPVETTSNYIKFQGEEYEFTFVHDITKRIKADEEIKKALREKEVMLKEIHHRVKNNLQIIISLLKLQAAQIKDKQALKAFEDSKARIRSISLVHEKLYRSEDFSKIDLGGYIESLAQELFRAYQTTDRISLDLHIQDIVLGINTAIPCGLILNELITNALKHAFPKGKKGRIRISFRPLKSQLYELSVQDNGVGIPDHIHVEETESLGLRLIKILTEQIGGSVTVKRDKGTIFTIKFPSSEK